MNLVGIRKANSLRINIRKKRLLTIGTDLIGRNLPLDWLIF